MFVSSIYRLDCRHEFSKGLCIPEASSYILFEPWTFLGDNAAFFRPLGDVICDRMLA